MMKELLKSYVKKYYQLIMLVGIVFLFRIVYVDLYDVVAPKIDITVSTCLTLYFSNALALLLSLVLLFMGVRRNASINLYGTSSILHILVLLLLVVSDSLIVSVILYYVPPTAVRLQALDLHPLSCIMYYSIGFLPINLLLCVMADLVIYFLRYDQQMRQMKQQHSKSQYQYHQLKQQLNPHFLFNSLNILDYLVQNGDKERASAFIKKLASIYRYLLNTGDSKTVTLAEELKFVDNYTDLLKERFIEGFNVLVSAEPSLMSRQIIPCALQLLVENAIKHNVANAQHPLFVKIITDGNSIVVSNNIQPKINVNPSTEVGLKNIERQYSDIADKSIIVSNDGATFSVTLPLL